jgi:hypothetical protein
MAEILRTAAAATQLVGQGISIAKKIHSFPNQVKGAPGKIKEASESYLCSSQYSRDCGEGRRRRRNEQKLGECGESYG